MEQKSKIICLGCGRTESLQFFCSSCLLRLPFISGTKCTVCGTGLISENGICLKCRDAEHLYDRNISIFNYSGLIPLLIKEFKNSRHLKVIEYLLILVSSYLKTFFSGCSIVPVPARRKNINKRGYDQMAVIAEALERLYGMPALFCLHRKGGKSQKTLTMEGRKQNISNTIKLKKKCIVPRIVLIDDVYTTGSTISECSRILKQGGAGQVFSLTIAKD